MRFVALDFETANEKRNSPCSLGLVVVENNKIVEEKYWLIKPPELRFEPMNIMIHGIREADVKNEREFKEIWLELLSYLDESVVIAHNAAFDMSVLRKTLDTYGIPYPNLTYFCTMIMTRQFYPFLQDAKLNTVNDFLGFKFNHHDALSDAKASANVLINIIQETGVTSIDELSDRMSIKIGKIYEGGYKSAGKKGLCRPISKKLAIKNKEEKIVSDFFKDKIVVFTGTLGTMKRDEAIMYVRKSGGRTGSSVTKKTNYLVTGGRGIKEMSLDEMTTKLRRGTILKNQGIDIKIIDEDEFLEFCFEKE